MNLNQVTLPSTDVERAARFYRELGFVQIVDSAPRYARFECPDGGGTLSLHQVDSLPGEPGVTLYFAGGNRRFPPWRLDSPGHNAG